MADRPGTPKAAAGVAAAPETAERAARPETVARPGRWRLGLATVGLVAVVGGLAAAVVSASAEPSPPALGGPILARGAAPTSTPPATASAPPATRVLPGPEPPGRLDGRASRPSGAMPVAISPVPVTAAPGNLGDPRTTAPALPTRVARSAAPAPAPTEGATP
ncbi:MULTISPECIES: hypothetical protein [unclassified Pseudofrankia]|uniref:hypothetical protein n=1 Tax=unclassified Pseudofrankia TaxID=2994372 RepID=UPI0008D944E9|nr:MULTISPECIES: hypothetical protein [unclassified Pseudofrankia]MDT3438887.1 hypothetical protein [Pseudofrankia sp. BMG5.37]OHV74817.1 hypothetical protein BCD48_00525 [Pseudofrankia sp. BMG5.36]